MKMQYFHFPKSGGRSIEILLRSRFGSGYIRTNGNFISGLDFLQSGDSLLNQQIKAWANIKLRKNVCIGGHIPPLGFVESKFSFIRSPDTRIVSAYYFFKKKNPAEMRGISFVDYVDMIGDGLYRLYYDGTSYDFIGIFEDFDKSFNKMSRLLDIGSDIPKVNVTRYERASDSSRLKELAYAASILKDDMLVYEDVVGSTSD
jgi:hypothetical protein